MIDRPAVGPVPTTGPMLATPSGDDGCAHHPAGAGGHGPATAGQPAPAGADWNGYAYPAVEPDRLTRLVDRIAARAPRWSAPTAILACFAGAVGYTLVTQPTVSSADAVPSCVVKLTTGFDCPGCGGTRAFWYALHGDLPAAARHHLVFVFALPFLVYIYLAWAGEQVFRRRLPQLRVTPTMLGVFLAAWMVFTVLRNLPWAPFTWFYV